MCLTAAELLETNAHLGVAFAYLYIDSAQDVFMRVRDQLPSHRGLASNLQPQFEKGSWKKDPNIQDCTGLLVLTAGRPI